MVRDIVQLHPDSKVCDRMSKNSLAVRVQRETDRQRDGTDSITLPADAEGNNVRSCGYKLAKIVGCTCLSDMLTSV